MAKNISIVHDFGIWLPESHALSMVCNELRIPLVCSPCGALSGWALRHKAWKKRLAWWLYQRRDLSRATLIVASSLGEVEDIQRLLPSKSVALIPNGVEIPAMVAEGDLCRDDRIRKAVFLGRIHPVKGLKNQVEAWHRVRPAGWHCIVAGPDKAGHEAELKAMLKHLNMASEFEFPGMMDDEDKWALLREADLFLLPSFTENFGLVVAEALACGVPVITTKATPWKGLVDHRCGWWVDIGVDPLAAALREAVALSDQQRRDMGLRGRQLVENNYSWANIGFKLQSVYDWALGKELKPDCVVPYKRKPLSIYAGDS